MSETASPLQPILVPARRRRRLLWNALGLLIAVAAIVGALCFWANSDEFAGMVRGRIIARLEAATGGRAEIASFHWRLRDLEAQAEGIVIHGTEDADEAPYLRVDRLHARVSVLGFLSPRILLRDLEIVRPQLHLIFYPNGSTNQPQPHGEHTAGRTGLDTLFDLRARHVAVEQGTIDFDNRAASFDSLNRYLPLDFDADDASVIMRYIPASFTSHESYHLDAGVRDLSLQRDVAGPSPPPAVHAFLQASLDLERSQAFLRSLRITATSKGVRDRSLELTGSLQDFAHPRWDARAAGDLDLHLLNPTIGYPFTPEGVAHLNLVAAGGGGEFRIDGPVRIEGASYVAPGVAARNLLVDTKVHADLKQLHISDIAVHFREGGQLDGDLLLEHWLPHATGLDQVSALEPIRQQTKSTRHFWSKHNTPAPPPPPKDSRLTLVKDPATEITVNGKIAAKFDDVALDTVMDIVGQEPFKRLGVDARLSGPATATWINGEVNTLTVAALLTINPSAVAIPREVPGNGMIDATYSQRDGSLALRMLELTLPASRIEAHGRMGAYPLSSPTDMNIDFRSQNLGEFDAVLRELGLSRNGKSGASALPVSLGGEADFHGAWAGSLLSPRLSGDLKASQVSVELPPLQNDPSAQPRIVKWDSIEANGSYDAARISILHADLRRGDSQFTADGTLSATATRVPSGQHHLRGDELPSFDLDSLLHARIRANRLSAADLLPMVGVNAPVQGTINAQLESDGPVRTLGVTGWAEITNALVYGEPIDRARIQGNLANQQVDLKTIEVHANAGVITGSGTYDLRQGRFQTRAQASSLDVARIEHLRAFNRGLSGKLGFQVTASGTADDPQIEGHASVERLAIGGDTVGGIDFIAHTVNHELVYEAASQVEAAALNLHGRTVLHGDFPTDARLDFSRFNVGVLIKLAHVQSLTADSAMAGFATVHGPLAHPDQMQGEANLQSAALTLAGVHLQSDGPVRAVLADSRVSLEPVHITGDQTDLHAQGTLGLKDTQPLDLKAGGSINLKLAETLDRDLTAGGTTTFQVEAHGPLANPGLRGRIDFENGSLSLEDVPNGLSQLHGTLEFNQNRLEVRSLTAMTGGGQLSVGGYLAYQHGLYADLSVTGKGIRIRYPQGVSSLADTNLHLQGTQPNLLLSGDVLLTRFSVSPDLDIAALASQANAVQPVAPPDAPSNHIRLDVRVQSSAQLNFQNAYAKLAGDVDLRVRGTVASPSLLGRISITEGNAIIAGTRYELQRGDIQFTNPVRIQPAIDLNATARVEDYDITLGLHGTPEKLSITYRSDPPLPEADVVALLALGRTQSEQGIYTQQQEQSAGLTPSTDVLLGGALNATVSSRVQKLFGAGSVKVDPNYLGALGNSTTRITVDEQLGKNVTLTYATNVDTSAQQLLQAEIAINRHVSLLVARDESGVFSMVLKATRRYR